MKRIDNQLIKKFKQSYFSFIDIKLIDFFTAGERESDGCRV